MFGYIASILGFQGQTHSANIDQGNASSRPGSRYTISCEGYGWTLPDKNIRVRVSGASNSIVQIFGFPPQEDFSKSMWYPPSTFGTNGPYIQYLLGESPASVKYIMGDNWRSHLQSDPRDSRKGDIIPRPSVDNNDARDTHPTAEDEPGVLEEERAHSLRMRRCGAVAIFSQRDILDYDATHRKGARTQLYSFGWPESGGVWVLRPPWLEPAPKRPVGYFTTDEELMENVIKTAEKDDVYYALEAKLERQESMEDVCRVLEEGGARFYAAIEDCPEVVEMNLCDK